MNLENKICIALVIFAFVNNIELGNGQKTDITFSLFATSMSDCDATSDCDLFVRIYCSSRQGQLCGETEAIQGHNSPVWPEVFTLDHTPGQNEKWKFELIDRDVAFDDLIATIEVDVDDYASKDGNLVSIPVPGNTGTFWIHRQR